MSKLEEEFRALVAGLPDVECKRLCARYCRSVPVSPAELILLERVKAKDGVRVRTMPAPGQEPLVFLHKAAGDPTCPMLKMGDCTVHEMRPLICRFYGVVESMPCVHGCKPTRWLSDEEADALYKKMADLTNRGLH